MESLDEKLSAALAAVAQAEGCRLEEIEIAGRGGKPILRVYIDKQGGVTVEDCARVSRQAELVIEAENLMEGSYLLEVSSPGLTRPLKKPADFRRAQGKLAALTLRGEVGGLTGTVTGVIESAGEISVTFRPPSGEPVEIPHERIARARLELEF
ncbi:MAG: ribosome maturation factor RimP [Nitrospinae bacterium]|nr:ribosome maturation factor RimP [Nitrospinota bacterium]